MIENCSLEPAVLHGIVAEIFRRSGLSASQAEAVARVIVAAERDHCKSHGIFRIPGNLEAIQKGKVNPVACPKLQCAENAILRVDARQGFSPLAFESGLEALVSRTREMGIAALVINNCVHFSALWHEIEALTSEGLAAIALCPTGSAVAPAGGTKALFGTNPFAFGWPRPGRDPYIFDFATSLVARGEIRMHHAAGTPIPAGWALDAEGLPTTDAAAALAGALLPFGGYKGSAISTMIELLGGPMIGDLNSIEALSSLGGATVLPQHGELILAMDPRAFAKGHADPFDKAEMIFEALLGQNVRLPSQRRYAARTISLRDGISLSRKEWQQLEQLRR